MANKADDKTNIMWMSFFKWKTSNILLWIQYSETGLILGLRQANKWGHYFVTTFLIGWVQA